MNQALHISRQFSIRAVMECIVHDGPISRASIAKQVGLSKQIISEIIAQLEEDGWVRKAGNTSGHVGRSAVNYEVVSTAAFIVAVDLGGTKVHVALADLACHVVSETVASTDARGGQFVIDQIAELCTQLISDLKIQKNKVRLTVVGVPGVPQQATGRVLMAPNIQGLDSMNVLEAFESALGMPVLLENDVNLAALGENWLGQGAGSKHLVLIALGTGIGAGLILNGELMRGATQAAGELGFLPFGGDPFEAESLRIGALERVVATSGIKQRYQLATGTPLAVPEIFQKAVAGEAAAIAVLDETARYLVQAIVSVCAVVNPQKVLLGGSIGSRTELLKRVQELLPQIFQSSVLVESCSLGSRAAIIGAAAIGLSHLHNTLFGVESMTSHVSLPTPAMMQSKSIT